MRLLTSLSFLFLLVLLIGCGGGSDGGSESNNTSGVSEASKNTCINNYYIKDAPKTGFALCVDNVDKDYCQKISEPDDTYGVNVLMISPSCVAVGFPVDSLDQTTGKDVYMQYKLYQDTSGTVDIPVDVASLFPKVDEEKLLKEQPGTVIQTTSKDAVFTTEPADGSVQVDGASLTGGTFKDGLVFDPTIAIEDSDVGKALFVDNVFKGMIVSVTKTASSITVHLTEADDISKVFNKLDLEVRNSGLLQAVQRSLAKSPSIGKYDYLNSEPLRATAYKKTTYARSGAAQDEIVLRIDIPKGYTVPSSTRSLNCSFWDASCDFTVSGQKSGQIGMGISVPEGSLTFDSTGSYIEIGIGSYIKAHYDHNTISANVFRVTGSQSAYFKAHVSFKVSGNLLGFNSMENKTYWSKDLDILEGLNVEILQPYSEVVRTGIIVDPILSLGAAIALNGTLSYQTTVERKGEIRFTYDSETKESNFNSTVTDKGTTLSDNNVNVGLEASGNVYLFPNLTYIPNIKILRLSKPISLVNLRSGAKLDATISGKIESGFVTVNDETALDSTKTEASVSAMLYGLVQGQFDIKIGNWDVYKNGNYIDITSKLFPQNILDWKAPMLKDPIITIKEDPKDSEKRLVTFSSNDKASVTGNLYYYYTLSDKDSAATDIPVDNISSHKPVWRTGNKAIEVKNGQFIKVRSVLYNKDVSDSIWAFGTSVSQQVKKQVVDVLEPVISPAETSFTDTLTVTITQDQGYDIYYSIDGGSSKKYSGPFSIDKTATVSAFTKAMVNGVQVLSKKVSVDYTKCGDNENLVDGVCTVVSCADNETLVDGKCEATGGSGNTSTGSCPSSYDSSMNGHHVDGYLGLTVDINIHDKDGDGHNEDRTECVYDTGGTYGVDDALIVETPYINDKMDGIYREYYSNGQLKSDIPYTNGISNGKGHLYYENGSIKWLETYVNGVLKHTTVYKTDGTIFDEIDW